MRTEPPDIRAGFSMLEVLLAVLILGLALTVFYGSANQGLAVAAQARDYQLARTLLQELDLREPLDLEELEEGEFRGRFRHDTAGNVDWVRRVEQATEDEEDRLYQLTTRVTWGDRDGVREEQVITFIHQPSAVQAGWVREPLDDL